MKLKTPFTTKPLIKFLSTKYESWQYEKEYRCFIELKNLQKEGDLYFENFSSRVCLREVILGPACTLPFERTRELVNKHHTDVVTYKSRLAHKFYSVVLMGDGTRQGTATIQNMAGWSAIATGDFNGDGTGNVLWRNADGITAAWFMQNGQISQTQSYSATAGWNEVATGDFNHDDGVTDVMWQSATSGEIDTWEFSHSGLLI